MFFFNKVKSMQTQFVSKTLLMPNLLVVQKFWCGVDTEMWKEDETTECSALSVGFTTETG